MVGERRSQGLVWAAFYPGTEGESRVPFLFEFHAKYNLGIVRWSGCVDSAEFVRAYRLFHEMPAWRPGLNHVSHARGAEAAGVGADAMRAQDALAEKANRGLPYRVATLVDSHITYGLSRMYQLRHDQSAAEVKVCSDQQEAADWVGCPVEVLDRS
jgi:hypothetical protein